MIRKCDWCGRGFEVTGTYTFTCSNKCIKERELFNRNKKQSLIKINQDKNKTINIKEIDPNQTLYDENGLAYLESVSKKYATSEEAQIAEIKTRFYLGLVGGIISMLGVFLCYKVSPFIGLPIAIIGIFIYYISKARILL
jgi:hypothetical protein